MKSLLKITAALAIMCYVGYADYDLVPEVLDTGVSNIASSITVVSSNGTSWTATPDYAGNPVWFVLSTNAGEVIMGANPDSVPITIYRNVLLAQGVFTGTVVFTDGVTQKTVTVITEVTTENCGIFPKICGESRAYAGVPYTLDARESIGWIDKYYWAVNLNPLIPEFIASNVVAEYTWYTPQSLQSGSPFTLTLLCLDPLNRIGTDNNAFFEVWNSPPTVDAGGPYYGNAGTEFTVTAEGSDPNPNEELEYRWDFDLDGEWDTSWNSSPSATHTYPASYFGLIKCEVRDTWPGGLGTDKYNSELRSEDVAQVYVTNQPPTVELSWTLEGGTHPSGWSVWTNYDEVVLVSMNTNISMRANPIDPDDTPGPLTVLWREHPANPETGLIEDASKTNLQITIDEFNIPGLYRYIVVANDGEWNSSIAELLVAVPGVNGSVIVDGFQASIPVWGAHPSTSAANTNAFGVHDTTQVRSDIDGQLFLDRPADAQCFVELERNVPHPNVEEQDYIFWTTISSNYTGKQVFRFPATRFLYGGRLVNAADLGEGMRYASATLIIRSVRVNALCNLGGGYSFGDLPLPWPTDNEVTGSYYIVFTKDGYSSLCLKKTPTEIQSGVMNDLWGLDETTNTISLSGTVKSSETDEPVADATVWFGTKFVTSDENGNFTFDELPTVTLGMPAGTPTHVLVAEGLGYQATRNIYTGTASGGNVDVYIDGGSFTVYGTIYDSISSEITTNGIVTTEFTASTKMKGNKFNTTEANIDKSGYFSLRVPGGINEITINANGMERTILVDRNIGVSQPVGTAFDVAVPEPMLIFSLLAFLTLIFRSLHNRMSI